MAKEHPFPSSAVRRFAGPPGSILAMLVGFWLLAGLACNFSGAGGSPTPEPAEALRLTLQAMSLPTPTPGPVVLATLAPETLPAPAATGLAGDTPIPVTGLPPAATLEPNPQGPFPTVTRIPDYPPHVGDQYTYIVRSGDTAESVARRFDMRTDEITSLPGGAGGGYLEPGQILFIPNKLGFTTLPYPLLPDSDLVNSPSAAGFDLAGFVQQAGGFLSSYSEEVGGTTLSGVQIIQRVADELSVNPRLLLAMLEYRAGWVYGQPANLDKEIYPIGFYVPDRAGLYEEIKILATQLNVGYYGWRQGTILHAVLADGTELRISPDLNAATAALQRLFGLFFRQQEDWRRSLYGVRSFPALYQRMYGDPWVRAAAVEPLLPANLAQPELELPFEAGVRWKYTGGPHDAWNAGTPRGALDFAPPNGVSANCQVSEDWVTAAAAGVVVRSANNALALDLDGDGREQTGWVLVHLHLASHELTPAGTVVALGDRLGHPSCEGGVSTARHLHITRKYNGEWLAATWPVAFNLGGWMAQVSESNYRGALLRDGELLQPSLFGGAGSYILRPAP